jgi:malonyl CoA-acyl carrier protein transacylase
MGGDLFDRFRDLTAKADGILGYSIKELCLEDPRNELGNTRFTQPALYVVNALSYWKKLEETGKTPDFLVGHSLGEFNALMAAGCFDFETGLRLVQKRGELMGEVAGGAMAAVLNASKDQIEEALQKNGLNNVFLANYNTPSQIVLSGLLDEISRAQPFFQEGKMRYYPLVTSGAFHSPFMQGVKEEFKEYLEGFEFADPKIPVIANVTARPYQHDAVVKMLANQIASTVQWCESIQYLLSIGVSQGETVEFEEVGFGDVLTKLVYTIKVQTPDSLLQQFANEHHGARPKPGDAEAKVAAWNQAHPIGTRMKSSIADYDDLETRTQAVVLFGHRAAVYMKGYNGYFDLTELAKI